MDRDFLEAKAKELLDKNQITKSKGTWFHALGRWIHRLAGLTSLIPGSWKKIPKAKLSLRPDLEQRLQEKYDLYCELIEKHQCAQGFILTEHCDSTLFSGLLSNVDLKKQPLLEGARDFAGYWQRRPVDHPPCYPDHSKSSISRDMMLGILWYCWFQNKGCLLADTYRHLRRHDFIMGFGDPSRLILMPGLEATMAEIVHQYGGQTSWWARNMIQSWPTSLTGYEVHLAIVHALLRGDIKGHISPKMLEMLKNYAERHPHNPLYVLAYSLYYKGQIDDCVEMLLDDRIWPSNRLPKRGDRRSDWVTQRDYGADWEPDSENPDKEHSGGDFLFVAWLILRELRDASKS